MSDLELLWLNDNKLTSIPGSLTDLTKLTDLDLSWNSIKGSIPAEITKMTLLSSIDFYANTMSGSIPSDLGALTNLRHITFSNNHLAGAIPESVTKLTHLISLDLEINSGLTGCEVIREKMDVAVPGCNVKCDL